jgi:two-component system nitrate/nitrite response regulator NarL
VFSFDSTHPVRLLVVDSSRIGSQLLRESLVGKQFEVLYSGASAQEAATEISQKQVDVALISALLEDDPRKGYGLAAQVKCVVGGPRVVMIVDHSDRESVLLAFRSGALGIFGRDGSMELLGKCISRVHEGQVWATSSELRYLLEVLAAPPQIRLVSARGDILLSPREQEVVHWVTEGLTNREIADRLGLTENTIKNYMFRIFEKLGISKRVELVLYAASQLNPPAPAPRSSNVPTVLENDAATFRRCRDATECFESNLYALGERFRDGRGVAANKLTALMWFFAAEQFATSIVPQARKAVLELQEQLSVDQVASAHTRARQWVQNRLPQQI